jgi:tagatose-6-phosphate ketose/aldose isomerase
MLAELAQLPALRDLLAASPEEQIQQGYGHTWREIAQQPSLWETTLATLEPRRRDLELALRGRWGADLPQSVLLTGSGASGYVGDCLAPVLQARLGVPVRTVASGAILLQPEGYLPRGSSLMVSFARSGNSPESCASVDLALERAPGCRHLAVTCNPRGALATRYRGHPAVTTLVLDERSNDRSLVMTSGFTSLVLAGLALATLDDWPAFEETVSRLTALAKRLLLQHTQTLADLARAPFRSAVFLGSGARYGTALEGSLLMRELTDGRVASLAESYLGLRHGPMSAVHDDTLLVCHLASDGFLRAYEWDLLEELDRKRPAAPKLLIGERVEHRGPPHRVVELSGLKDLGEAGEAIVQVVASQILSFFRSLAEGLRPDSPSPDAILTRVVGEFPLHRREPL